MLLKPEELENNGYQILETLSHQDIIPFIQKYLKKNTFHTFAFYVSNLFTILLTTTFILINYNHPQLSFSFIFNNIALGLGFSILLIPVHEIIHGIAYKTQGAKHVSYDAILKKLYFMAIADKYVINRKELKIIALAPFIVISSTLLILLLFVNLNVSFIALGTLIMHTSFCSGDFGLLCFFDYYKDKDVVTYDDKENGISYFYAK